MPRFSNRSAAGQPTRPYKDALVNAGSDCWLQLTFLDRFDNPATPVAVTMRIDNLTDTIQVMPTTPITGPTSPSNSMEVNIPASMNQMLYNWRGSQLMQVTITATYSDRSQTAKPYVYELTAIATANAG